MTEVVRFMPLNKQTATENLFAFIAFCKFKLKGLVSPEQFEMVAWDVTAELKLKAKREVRRLHFVQGSPRGPGVRDLTPMPSPFCEFAKAYLIYQHAMRRSTGIGARLVVLRAVLRVLQESGQSLDPCDLTASDFNAAAALLAHGRTADSAYRHGQQLEILATSMAELRLLRVPTVWRNSIRRPLDRNRIGPEFDLQRMRAMPSPAALTGLTSAYKMASDPLDVAVTSICGLLMSAPERINEVLRLSVSCEVSEFSSSGSAKGYALRWPGSKGAPPGIKLIPASMVDLVKDCISRLMRVSAPARAIARWYAENPGKLYLPSESECLRSKQYLTLGEVASVLFAVDVPKSVTRSWCTRNKVPIRRLGRSVVVLFADLETAVLQLLPIGFPWLDKSIDLRYADALCLLRRNETHANRATYACMFWPIAVGDVAGRICSKYKETIFDLLDLKEDDGAPIRIRTHQFRHYINTLAQMAGMDQIDIAKWSGRVDVRQNAAYDHVSSVDVLAAIRQAIGNGVNPSLSIAIPAEAQLELIARAEFIRMKVPAAHTTDFGYCVHDFAMLPCQLHRDCINCDEHFCLKGEPRLERYIDFQIQETESLLGAASLGAQNGASGAGRWVEHQRLALSRLEGIRAVLRSHQVPTGAVISPAGVRVASKIEQACQAAYDRLGAPMAAGEGASRHE